MNAQTPDSAATASAILRGVKTISATFGFDSSIVYNNGQSESTAKKVSSVMEWAQNAGKHTGKKNSLENIEI